MASKRMQYLESSGIRKMFELASRMRDPIDLSLGQADFDVPEAVKEAAIEAIRKGRNGYTVTRGVPSLLKAIDQQLQVEGLHPQSTMVTSGASGALVLAMMALADDSVDVLVPDPYFATYGHIVRLSGARPVLVDTYPDFRLTPEKIKAAMTERASILLFNSPVNPTGVAYTASEIQALAQTTQALGLQVIADEVYDQFSYDHPHVSFMKFDSQTLLIRAFSKSLGMAGWRIGFAAGPANIIQDMLTLQQFTFVCATSPAQWGCAEGLKGGAMPSFIKAYSRKRDLLMSGLDGQFNFVRPQGAFYVFAAYPDGDGDRFMARCLEEEVLVVPGKAFSTKNSHFRISFATSEEKLKRGIERLHRACQ